MLANQIRPTTLSDAIVFRVYPSLFGHCPLYFCASDLQCTGPINFGRDKLTCSEAAKSALDRVEIIRFLIGREERIFSFSGVVPIVKH